MRTLVRTVLPASEPITLDQAYAHLRMPSSNLKIIGYPLPISNPVSVAPSQDAYIAALITAAREYCEAESNRAFINQSWRLSLDYFPYYGAITTRQVSNITTFALGLWTEFLTINIPVPHLQSIDSVTYIDSYGNTQTLDPSTYIVDLDSEPARICPVPNTYWPYPSLYRPNTVQINFTCGWGPDATTVPLGVQQAMLMLISHWYWNRDAVVQGQYGPIPMAVDALLAPYKVISFGYNHVG